MHYECTDIYMNLPTFQPDMDGDLTFRRGRGN